MRMRKGETTCARERERVRGVKERERERQKAKEQMKFKETVTHNIRQSALKMKL
jgi:hypothetical protein